MKKVKQCAALGTGAGAALAALFVLLACVIPEQLKAADLGGNVTRLIGDFTGIAHNLQRPVQEGLQCRENSEVTRMQQSDDRQQGAAKPSAKPEQKPVPRPGTEKQQTNRNTRSGMAIPQRQFRSRLGRQHTFQIQQLNGNRFQAAGFVFEVVDPWPPVFSFDDPFFIDEIDEQFFLFDVNHPGVRTLVIVVQEL